MTPMLPNRPSGNSSLSAASILKDSLQRRVATIMSFAAETLRLRARRNFISTTLTRASEVGLVGSIGTPHSVTVAVFASDLSGNAFEKISGSCNYQLSMSAPYNASIPSHFAYPELFQRGPFRLGKPLSECVLRLRLFFHQLLRNFWYWCR